MLKIPFAKISCNGNELQYVREVIESGWLTTASKTQQFEKLFAQTIDVKYACAVNSCTSALHLAIDAIGVQPGDKVFVPAMTFTATAEVVRYLNAHPILLDIEYGTNLITPDILLAAIKKHPDVKFLILVHFGGHPAELINETENGIIDICRKNQIKIVEDAAHAFPAKIMDKTIGSLGDITCFSFYANKTITTGEGGMITTNNEDYYLRIKTMRLHGINRDIWDRFTSDKPSWEYDVVAPGFKYNMPDLNAAIGLAQLERAELMRMQRQKIAEQYYNELQQISAIDLPLCKIPIEQHAWHLFPIVLNEHAKISRNQMIEKLADAGIGTSVHYKPLYQMTYYKTQYNFIPEEFPNTEKTWKGNFSLPIYPDLSIPEVHYICETIRAILK